MIINYFNIEGLKFRDDAGASEVNQVIMPFWSADNSNESDFNYPPVKG